MTLKFKIPKPFDLIFSVSVRVTNDGDFTCTLPDEIAKLFDGKISLNVTRLGRDGYFSSKTLDGLRTDIEKKIKELCSEKEVSSEKIIRFAIETACSYAIDDKGDFLPNPNKSEGWRGGTVSLDACNRSPYGLRIYAHPFEKITYRYEATGKERVEYKSLYVHDFGKDVKDDPIQWLCNLHTLDGKELKTQEMPCTKESLLFFVNLFKWLFSVNERIKPFLNPSGIELLATRGIVPMLADNSTTQTEKQ